MKSFNHRLLALTLASMVGTVAMASSLAAPTLPGFKRYDSNGDGFVSQEEFKAQGGQEQAFRAGDANHDDRLDRDEFVKASATNDRIKAGKYVDDAWITAKVKALLLKDEGVKGLDVNVETHQGTVQLSGWVNNPVQIAQAEKIARGVDGVTGVKNDLMVAH
ncbi:BON domain-containing protein [Thiobacillus sedimenti]|uniref:BON domain-containing protein n=1 Tax=Thiobacillus sedimenti TaxID=3110231 RepID=A0ABZ1CIJ0_9PROT|nr:BON domain-containing protein [Thiobacillus sp. SCUT-2]WRS39208.1 BON domain-containing protein [Thiobacillus sp. SCUT-2]